MILNFHSSRIHIQWNVQSIGDIISFRMYDSYFHHDVRGHGAGVMLPISMRVDFFFFFLAIFLQIYPSFSLFVSLFLFSFLLGIYLIFLFWPCLFTETSRAFEKRQGQSRFSELNFSGFFRHLKASDVLLVCASGLILRAYKVTVLAHKKKPLLIESMNKCGCEGRSKSHCQQLRKNTLRQSKGYWATNQVRICFLNKI